jgi:Carboxypeptidase regulatory-like domain
MSSKKRACTVLVLLLCVAGIAVPVFGQAVNGSLVGSVTDISGAAIPNARITIVERATGISRGAVTNESGNYNFPDLTPGRYTVAIEASGFKKEERPVDVIVDSTARVDLQMQPGSATEVIEVTDVPPLLQTDRADVSTKLEAEQVVDLPLSVNRNFQTLLNLVPGTEPATFQHSQFFNAQSTLQTEVNGQPREGNSYQIEGIDDDERTGLLQILIPPAEAISTVDVSTNDYDAELGRAIGAVTNAILKSGSNSFHGSAMEYLQNSAFNARSYFNPVLGHVAYNYFGGSFGGPIKKDKIFFYGDYFRTSDHEANSNLVTIPFPQFYTPNANGFIDLSAGLKASGQGQIYDPATGNQTTGAGRTPFPGNLIPLSRVNPVSLALLNLLPAPNQNLGSVSAPVNNYAAALPFQKTADTYDGKVDWELTAKDHLSGRFSDQHINTFQAPIFGPKGGGPAQGNFEGIGTNNSYSTGVNYDHIFSPTLLTEARLGVAHYRNTANPSDFGQNDASAIGIPGVNISPFTSGQVGIAIDDTFSSPLIGYSASLPWIRGEANIDFANHWTKIVGNHTFKFGADIRRIRDDLLQDQTFSPRGVITFGANQTSVPGASTDFANDLASFLLDVPRQVGRDVNTFFPAYRQWWFFTFAGDKWQVTPKLTVSSTSNVRSN